MYVYVRVYINVYVWGECVGDMHVCRDGGVGMCVCGRVSK